MTNKNDISKCGLGSIKSLKRGVGNVSKNRKNNVSKVVFDELENANEEIIRLRSELKRINSELEHQISERHRIEMHLARSKDHDFLTGLPHRDLLVKRLAQAVSYADRHGSQVILIYLDLDDFSNINDTHGKIYGDVVLKEVAKRISNCTRHYDTLARLNSDKFALIINDLNEIHDIVKFAEKVRGAFRGPFNILGQILNITPSIGVAIYPIHTTNTESLMRMAQIAASQAKSEGKNTFRFYSSSGFCINDEPQRMEERLRSALERGEFLPHYQPRINTTSGRITGMEALLRWQPPDEQLLFPEEFFPFLEESGLVIPVGEWFLEKVCRQVKDWQNAGLPLFRVAVNLSATQLCQETLPDRVSDILAKTGLDPMFLEFDLTEQTIMEDIVKSISILKRMKDIGITISIGNFGTGYVSLSFLNMVPFDELKIDRSFVKGVTLNPNDAKVVSASLALGRNLGKILVAEGVESKDQYDFLTHHRCDEMQGYFFSRPLCSSEFEKWCVCSDRWGATIQ